VKVAAMAAYFAQAEPADAAWALFFLSGRKIRRLLGVRKLHVWALGETGVPAWLFAESYDAVGDLAETIALLLPDPAAREAEEWPLHRWVAERLLPLQTADEATQRAIVVGAWRALDSHERLVWNKLITGAFRVGVSQLLVIRALAAVSGVDPAVIAHRLMGDWAPTAAFYANLMAAESAAPALGLPYPFCLAYPIDDPAASLGSLGDWQVEWKWDGIRAQLVRRAGQAFLWSRGEELVTERFPELAALAEQLPEGTVLDGEILPWKDGRVLSFAQLQRRIGRKTLSRSILSEVPVALVAFDLLEWGGQDVRGQPLSERRTRLETLVATLDDARLQVSPPVTAETWAALTEIREESRARNAEGFMLKRRTSAYGVGRQRGDWWKWKIAPYTIDAVLIYAQPGSGKRASLFSDYTFGVWDGGVLVPIAKAYSGLTDAEIREVDRFVREHTLEKHGPVRTVQPTLVFELAFEGLQPSTRHRAGIAVRFPRMARWRHDKSAADADTLETVWALLPKDAAAPTGRTLEHKGRRGSGEEG
jgi:DNA ligase-1